MTRPWWILGGGYTGTRLARALAGRPELASAVTITRRDGEAARALAATLGRGSAGSVGAGSVDAGGVGAGSVDAGGVGAGSVGAGDVGAGSVGAGDVSVSVRGERAELADPGSLAIPVGAIVVCTAPPGADPAGELRALQAAAAGASRLIYISSTGVYGAGGGAEVDESWPLAPITASGRARVAAEAALAACPVPWLALRAAGIYGPGRGLVERVRAGTYRVIGDGTSHVARIHVDDLVAAILAAAARGQVTGAVNAADDDPAPIGMVADAVAARLGLPSPPRVAATAVSPEVAGMLTADRRIINRRLRTELGVVLRYPSWRDALAAELAGASAR